MLDDILSGKQSGPPPAEATPQRQRTMFDDILSSKPSGSASSAPAEATPSRQTTLFDDMVSGKPTADDGGGDVNMGGYEPSATRSGRPRRQRAPPAADPLNLFSPKQPSSPAPQRELFSEREGAALAREKRLNDDWSARLAEVNKMLAEKEAEVLKLQSASGAHQLEKERLEEHIALLKRLAEEERSQLEESCRHRLATADESYQRREKQLMEENSRLRDEFRDRLKRHQEEASWAATSHLRHLSTIEGVQSAEFGRLKTTYEESLAGMRGEHEMVVARLSELRNAEVDAVRSTSKYTGMLDDAIHQLQKTSDVTEDLLARISHKYDVTLQARETLLREKEQQLKETEGKLERVQQDTTKEREHLQELIAKLQYNLDASSSEAKEAKHRLEQQQVRVEAREAALDRERSALVERVERERQQLEGFRRELLEEQRLWLEEVNSERHDIAAAHARLDARLRLAGLPERSRGTKFVPDHQPTVAELDGMYRTLAEERTAAAEERDRLAALQAEAKQAVLAADSRQQAMSRELERLQSQAQLLKLKSQEVDDVSEMAMRTRDDGRRALDEAHALRGELTKQQLLLERQQSKVKAQEQLLAQERMRLIQERQARPSRARPGPGPGPGPASGAGLSVPVGGAERTLGDGAPGSEVVSVDPTVLLWKLRADEDREFLDREAAFIKQLTSSS
ncbi:fas-binding factor 1-like [Pollicipes pollicipes]|uniref:fas-binding factor 1-like n=1 Tax=Pollicipes pollicipes TaxID=41117 RepID=UPI001884F7A9|nr:fas-binding factor 1-like [Pollicipes pollicipes]